MRIRIALTGLALGATSLFLIAPAAFASGAASAAPVPTSSTAASPTPTSTHPPTPPSQPAPPSVTTVTVKPGQPKPPVVKPKGAAETGGGLETESTQGSGAFLVGGAALLAVGGVGAVGYRRFRRQS
jgi:hypothetical protein